ncbi:hypothetical protein [Cribrihabitans pelagius]
MAVLTNINTGIAKKSCGLSKGIYNSEWANASGTGTAGSDLKVKD